MPPFTTNVAVRWSDMDVYGHVNNARVVTLLEEARTELLFGEGARRGAETLAEGVIVVELAVRYRLPLVYSATPVWVRLWVSELRGASFTLVYGVSAAEGDDYAVTASTQLAPYEIVAKRPRRLTPAEREFLATFQDGVVTADTLTASVVTETASVVTETASVVTETASVVTETASVVTETASVVTETASVVTDGDDSA